MPRASSVCAKPGCPDTATDHGRCSTHRREVVGTGARGSTRADRKERREVLEAANWCCFYCAAIGRKSQADVVDHFIPITRGGSNDRSNKVAACTECNAAKGSLMPAEFMRRRLATA